MEHFLIISSSVLAVVLFVIGVPILLIIGLWVVSVSLVIDFTLANIGVTLYEGLSFFGLLAMPLFVLTGDLINAAGIARRLSEFAHASIGWMRGGLGMSSLGASAMFSAISGSNAATTATIGSIMYPEMVKDGYPKRFAAATIAAGGTVGIIIPPSIVFIVYGFLMNLSISDLFIAGILPGILMIVGMQIACFLVAWRTKSGHVIAFEPKKVLRTGVRAYLGFFAIFIVIYGIYSGIFSPTEAAGMTAGYCLFAGLLITRELKMRDLPAVIFRSGQITGLLAPLIAVSIVMQQLLVLLGAKEFIVEMMASFGGYYPILFMCMLIVLIGGTVLESLPNTVILAPILAPIAATIGVDPIHFAVIFLIGDAIGFITPPYGLNLYVASGITGIPYLRLLKFTVPYLLALLVVWAAVAFFPGLSLELIPSTR